MTMVFLFILRYTINRKMKLKEVFYEQRYQKRHSICRTQCHHCR